MHWIIQIDSDGCPPSQMGWPLEGTKDQAIAELAKNTPKMGTGEIACLYEVDLLDNKGYGVHAMQGEGTYCCNHLECRVLKEVEFERIGMCYTGLNGWNGYMIYETAIPKEVMDCVVNDRDYLHFRTKTKLEFVWDTDRMENMFLERQKEIIVGGGNVSELLRSKWY